jgi:uncharacterized BrkB/YihY/UPF0761 family membrane protein
MPLGIAAVLAYLSADHDHRGAKHATASEKDVSPTEAMVTSGHGRHATAPNHIPASGWKDILWRTYEQINDDRLLAVAAGVVFYGLLALFPAITAIVSWPALAILLLLALAVLYRFAPSRRTPKWRWISVGSVVATLTWMAASALLSYYLSNFGHYDATYGSLGAAIALMIWMWMSTIVILFGAELNSEIEHQTTADSTTGVPKPLGARGAKMADSVGASYPA